MSETVSFKESQQGEWNVLQISGRLDLAAAPQAEEPCRAALQRSQKLALDLSELAYVASAGLRVLVNLIKQAKKEQKLLAFCGVTGMAEKILRESGMSMLCPSYGSPAELP